MCDTYGWVSWTLTSVIKQMIHMCASYVCFICVLHMCRTWVLSHSCVTHMNECHDTHECHQTNDSYVCFICVLHMCICVLHMCASYMCRTWVLSHSCATHMHACRDTHECHECTDSYVWFICVLHMCASYVLWHSWVSWNNWFICVLHMCASYVPWHSWVSWNNWFRLEV